MPSAERRRETVRTESVRRPATHHLSERRGPQWPRCRGPASRTSGLIGLKARRPGPRTRQLRRAAVTAQSGADRCEVRKLEANQQRLRPAGAGLSQ